MSISKDTVILDKIDLEDNITLDDSELKTFLISWDEKYLQKIVTIDIFNTFKTSNLTDKQKEYLVRAFYHIRGHFHKFLWYLGNHAPDKKTKDKILYNIEEEFGGNTLSHEQFYFEFCKSVGFDISDEFISEATHEPFIKEFNICHLQWLKNHSWENNWAFFSAYERLDNIDYKNLLNLAKSIGAKDIALNFFIIHSKADHFDRTCEDLKKIWKRNKDIVIEAFEFIGQKQIKMWQLFSEAVFSK